MPPPPSRAKTVFPRVPRKEARPHPFCARMSFHGSQENDQREDLINPLAPSSPSLLDTARLIAEEAKRIDLFRYDRAGFYSLFAALPNDNNSARSLFFPFVYIEEGRGNWRRAEFSLFSSLFLLETPLPGGGFFSSEREMRLWFSKRVKRDFLLSSLFVYRPIGLARGMKAFSFDVGALRSPSARWLAFSFSGLPLFFPG